MKKIARVLVEFDEEDLEEQREEDGLTDEEVRALAPGQWAEKLGSCPFCGDSTKTTVLSWEDPPEGG